MKIKRKFRLNRPEAPATDRQRALLSRLTNDRSIFDMELTMQAASNLIQKAIAASRLVSTGQVATMTDDNQAEPPAARLHDDIMCDILVIVADGKGQQFTPQDISKGFLHQGHRVDVATINKALNYTVENPTFPLYAETRQAIVTDTITRPKHGAAPKWYLLFHPPANVPAVAKTAPVAIPQTGTKFDNVAPEINTLLDEMSQRPGMKKRTGVLSHLIRRGAVATGQDQSSLHQKVDTMQEQMKLIMQHFAITDQSNDGAKEAAD
jgi:hypothetical protein